MFPDRRPDHHWLSSMPCKRCSRRLWPWSTSPHSRFGFSPVRLGIAVLLLAVIAFFARRNGVSLRQQVWFWLGWPVLALLAAANLLRQEAQYDERYVFLASLAVFAIAAQIACLPVAAPFLGPYVAPAAIALLIGYAAISFHRGTFFRDDIAFSRQWIRTNPGSVNAHYNLAFALAKQGDAAGAAEEYTETLRIHPGYTKAHCNLANALSTLGRLDEAIEHYREALRLDPNYEAAHNNFGVALAHKGRLEEAIRQFRDVLRLNPSSAGAHNDIGNALAARGEYAQAASEFAAALRLNPGLADAHNNLGNVLAAQNNLQAAVSEYQQALRIRPDHEDARGAISRCLRRSCKKNGRMRLRDEPGVRFVSTPRTETSTDASTASGIAGARVCRPIAQVPLFSSE
jgi:tetratricopeptide (TPR) repeat protein